MDIDRDNNDELDASEVGDPNNPTNTDGTSPSNYLDPDNDDDDYSDVEETEAGTNKNDASSKPEERDEGGWSGSWGDPHISTPDNNRYSFQAVGDYVLTRSTKPGDSFEIQVRYSPFSNNGSLWSGESALAARVLTDKVELYALPNRQFSLYINNVLAQLPSNNEIELDGGGKIVFVQVGNQLIHLTIAWPDGTVLITNLNSPDVTRAVRGFTRIYFPKERRRSVQGLLGNFDGIKSNDFRLRDGSLALSWSEKLLYIGGFRDAWSIAKGARFHCLAKVLIPTMNYIPVPSSL